MSPDARGTLYMLASAALFAVLYFYYRFLPGLPGNELYAWRIVFSVPVMSLFLFSPTYRKQFVQLIQRIVRYPATLARSAVTALFLGTQLWLFMWAPSNGYAMEVSVGYFLLPLFLALSGRVFYKEKFGAWKRLAFIVSLAGFAAGLAGGQGISWPTFVVCLGYPAYYILRQKFKTDNMGGFIFDIYLSLPVALLLIYLSPEALPDAGSLVVLSGLGLIGTVAMVLLIMASQKLSMILFGLLSYVEPVLLILVSIAVGQLPEPSQYLSYTCIGISILLLLTEKAAPWLLKKKK